MLINNETGQDTAERIVPEHLLLEEKGRTGRLLDWDISILQSIPMAASVAAERYLEVYRIPFDGSYLCCLSEGGECYLRTVEGGMGELR